MFFKQKTAYEVKSRFSVPSAGDRKSAAGFLRFGHGQAAALRYSRLDRRHRQSADQECPRESHRIPPELNVAITVRSVLIFLARSSGMCTEKGAGVCGSRARST